jgi:cytochrome c biogenesis protein CcdA/thiol-disulfide isomerase/thioredoxin
MLTFILAYLGGVLTIISPCILPVVPFVFASADRPFVRGGLPLLAGMALTFTLVATLAAVGGGWAVSTNEYGRFIAIGVLALFGLTLLFPAFADAMTAPAVRLGNRLSNAVSTPGAAREPGVGASMLLGAATGLLWAPCAGPVLGLILTGAALQGANVRTSLLLMTFGAGAATSLGLALVVGGRVFSAMKRALGATEWIRRGLGVAVLVAVAAIALGADTGFLTRVSLAGTATVEQRLIDRIHPADTAAAGSMTGGAAIAGGGVTSARDAGPAEASAFEGRLPSLSGAVQWLNSRPLTAEALKGRVVLIDFWTYSCINCLRAIPYVRAWDEKYRAQGLVVIGVHAPEFAFEKNVANVSKAVADLQVKYPVAIDNDYAIWRAFDNRYWPAHYFVDAEGRVRHHHFGEGGYDESERVIQQLLAEAGQHAVPSGIVAVEAKGAEAPSNDANVASPETYVGYGRAERFVSPGGAAQDTRKVYAEGHLRLNQWSLKGTWTVGKEQATLAKAGGGIAYRFQARDLHLVLAAPLGKPVRFRITIDGKPPADSQGVDVDASGQGVVTGQRLYQLVRQHGTASEHTFEIMFFDAGVQAYAFTFG